MQGSFRLIFSDFLGCLGPFRFIPSDFMISFEVSGVILEGSWIVCANLYSFCNL